MTDAFANSRSRSSIWPPTRWRSVAEDLRSGSRPSPISASTLDCFVVENLSLPDELQKILDQRIEHEHVGDMGKYTQFQAAQSIPIAAANEGGGAGIGAGLGAGIAMGQAIAGAVQGSMANAQAPAAGGGGAPAAGGGAAAGSATKFCMSCGKPIPRSAGFCPECGKPQQ